MTGYSDFVDCAKGYFKNILDALEADKGDNIVFNFIWNHGDDVGAGLMAQRFKYNGVDTCLFLELVKHDYGSSLQRRLVDWKSLPQDLYDCVVKECNSLPKGSVARGFIEDLKRYDESYGKPKRAATSYPLVDKVKFRKALFSTKIGDFFEYAYRPDKATPYGEILLTLAMFKRGPNPTGMKYDVYAVLAGEFDDVLKVIAKTNADVDVQLIVEVKLENGKAHWVAVDIEKQRGGAFRGAVFDAISGGDEKGRLFLSHTLEVSRKIFECFPGADLRINDTRVLVDPSAKGCGRICMNVVGQFATKKHDLRRSGKSIYDVLTVGAPVGVGNNLHFSSFSGFDFSMEGKEKEWKSMAVRFISDKGEGFVEAEMREGSAEALKGCLLELEARAR